MVVGVPLNAPVVVLKVMPAGAAGEMAKLAIAPPVDVTVKPVDAVLTVVVSLEEESVNAGAPNATIKVNVLEYEPVALVPVMVYAVAVAVVVGVPLKAPVLALKVMPAGAAGEMA